MSASDDEGEAAPAPEEELRIAKVTCVTGPGLRAPWLPDVQTVAATEFIKLTKWSRELTQYCTGESLNLHKKGTKRKPHNINCVWFHDMAERRRSACNAALRAVVVEAAAEGQAAAPKKFRPATDADQWLAGRTVIVDAPAIHEDGQCKADARHIKMLWGVKGHDLWVELTKANLEYARAAIKVSPPYEPEKKASPKRKRRRRTRANNPLEEQEDAGQEHKEHQPAEEAQPSQEEGH